MIVTLILLGCIFFGVAYLSYHYGKQVGFNEGYLTGYDDNRRRCVLCGTRPLPTGR